jgi:hypothetical protein
MVLVGGCSNPKAANRTNFEKAIREYVNHEAENGKWCMGPKDYPKTWEEPFDDRPFTTLQFTRKASKVGSHWIYSIWLYELTEEGRKFHTPGKGFCFAEPDLVEIGSFSEPSSFGPYTMSEVHYELKFKNIPQWTRQKAFLDWFRGNSEVLAILNSQRVQDKATLILTNSGWVHEKLFNK